MDIPTFSDRFTAKAPGKLTIFASYFPGTGKAHAMLEAARTAKQEGLDVVIGLLSCDRWPSVGKLAEDLEAVRCKTVTQDGRTESEIDLDACIQRLPQLILVDDLSHTNLGESRHRKRYQDIDELLKAGIDVYTTLDIQHIESIQDTVFSILGSSIPERIPDRVFDRASQVEFIDIEPERLQQRLLQQKKVSLLSNYSLSQLSALREIGLRRCADRAALYTQAGQHGTGYRSHEHILVCLSSAPSNEKIIRTAARMAGAFKCEFTALFVETKDFQRMSQPDKERLRANIHLAQQLGASIETVYGDDVAYQISEFSHLSGVTKIVLGRSGFPPRPWLRKAALTERLIELTPELDIHIIPDNGMNNLFSAKHREIMHMPRLSVLDLLKSVLILVSATLIGFLFYNLGFTEANIITLYILGVMLISVSTQSSICSFFASILSVLTFNFFFTDPRFSLHSYDSGYPVTFLVMFLASLLTGSLASKLKSHAKRSAQVAWRTKLLFETNQNLQKARTQEEILSVTAKQLLKIFQRDIIVYRIKDEKTVAPETFLADNTSSPDRYTSEKEREIAQWVAANNKRAGAGTETFSDSRCTYLSVRTGDQIYGVVGIAASDKPLDSFEASILLSVLGECGLALENKKNLEEKEAAAVLAKNEQLRANLLRSISHDLRTPLTSISGNASNLLSNGNLFDSKTKEQMYTDIYDDAMWLINLVENLLSVSRLEEGRMNLHVSTELIDEVVAEALRHINRKSVEYHLNVQNSEEYLLAQIDAKLIVQVLINIVDNAIKYTPPGSEINIGWQRKGDSIYISIADNGPGIPDQAKPHIFDMFYTASNQIADSRRSMGLGLALCKSIVNAHGGEITVADHLPHGSIFTFSVPAGEVELHE
ncbi:sensor histidine kinase [Faecalibacterium gallinarum]|uniref:histidine kinase n=1 Tax=Faecalibacterium gallinarum TaxID=2903556 RepID=A0AA37J2B2_9FIRM|nr:sensor histidine kinase KdpD [Faecalibacterium gallinarum]GJN65511.1 sensor protein KdpD [Faecalibacterium gallinarum]